MVNSPYCGHISEISPCVQQLCAVTLLLLLLHRSAGWGACGQVMPSVCDPPPCNTGNTSPNKPKRQFKIHSLSLQCAFDELNAKSSFQTVHITQACLKQGCQTHFSPGATCSPAWPAEGRTKKPYHNNPWITTLTNYSFSFSVFEVKIHTENLYN